MAKVTRGARLGSALLPELLDSLMVPAVGCGPHGQAAWVNAAARELFGAQDETQPGQLMQLWGAWYYPDRRPMPADEMPLKRVMAGQVIRNMEVMIKPPGGAPRYVLVSGVPWGPDHPGGAEAVVVLHDFTARRRTIQLNECQKRLADLLARPEPVEEILPEVVETIAVALEWTAAQFWVVDRVGQVLRHEINWDPGHVVPPELPELLKRDQGLLGRAWEAAGPVWALDLRTYPASAAQLVDWGQLRAGLAVPVPSGNSVVALMLFYSDSPEDSDDARAALLAGIAAMIGQFLERRRAERLDTERDVSRDEYLDMIGHEVRTPLTAIESCVELMTDGSRLGQEQSQLLTVIRRNAASMHVLIDKLLETAALRAGDVTVTRAAVNLTALCQAAAGDAHAAGLDVVVNASTRVIIDGDAGFLRRMVDELLHTAGHGGRIELNLQPEGPVAVVTVTMNRPQDPPSTPGTPGAGVPGTALGITFIRAIVQAHGGDLALNDSTDTVATFTVRLPTGGRPH